MGNRKLLEVGEDKLLAVFKKERVTPQRWSNGPHAVYGVHDHPYGKLLLVQQGSIEFHLPLENKDVKMFPGDRLDLPPHTPHSAVVGPKGVICWEGHSFGDSLVGEKGQSFKDCPPS